MIAIKDSPIQRLQTTPEYARRELDTIHRTRSPTLPLHVESKEAGIPAITISNTNDTSYSEVELGFLLLVKLRMLISDPRQACSRGYTTGTTARKLTELEEFIAEFQQLENSD